MSRQKELDVDAKAITKIELIGKSKKRKDYGKNNDSAQSMFLLTIWRKKKNKNNIFWNKCNSIINDGELWKRKC